MSDLINKLRAKFQDEEYRHAYAEECLNTMIAAQIKTLREQREMTQAGLAELTGMRQPRLSVLEDANYSNWSLNTLKRLARAFDVALTVRFDAFSELLLDFENMSKESLERPSFASDPLFRPNVAVVRRPRRVRRWNNLANVTVQQNLFPPPNVVELPAQPKLISKSVGTAPTRANAAVAQSIAAIAAAQLVAAQKGESSAVSLSSAS